MLHFSPHKRFLNSSKAWDPTNNMSSSSISQAPDHPDKQYPTAGMAQVEKRNCFSFRRKRTLFILCGILLAIVIALGVGLGVGLTRSSSSSDSASSTPAPPLPNNTNATAGSFWKPQAGVSWQVVLEYPLNVTYPDVDVFDFDLFDNPNSTISTLHALNRSVICYFSAGSYENWRPDADQFKPSDYGKELEGWPGEYWLNTTSSNVRNIMSARLALAASKGCDGVDPGKRASFSFLDIGSFRRRDMPFCTPGSRTTP